MAKGGLLGDPAAGRMAEQREPLDVQAVREPDDVVGEQVNPDVAVRQRCGPAVAPVVPVDQAVARAQRIKGAVGTVVQARTAVGDEQVRALASLFDPERTDRGRDDWHATLPSPKAGRSKAGRTVS